MKLPAVTIHIFEQNLKRFGQEFEVYRCSRNPVGEITGHPEKFLPQNPLGLYHVGSAFQKALQTTDSGKINSTRNHAFMCRYSDVEGVCPDDFVQFNGFWYQVTGVTDVYQDGAIADISLIEYQMPPQLTGRKPI